MIISPITKKSYIMDNDSCVFISNMKQSYLYLKNGAQEDLLDILFNGTKNNCLVFVFRISELVQHLYDLWNKHELN